MNLDITASGTPTLPKNDNVVLQRAEAIKRSTVQKSIPTNEQHIESVVTASEIKKVVESMNDFIDPLRTNLKFVFHEGLNEYYVAVVNPLTDEVVKEIPPKKMLDMYAAMAEFMGILIDEKI